MPWRIALRKCLECLKSSSLLPRPLPQFCQLLFLQQLAVELAEQLDVAGDVGTSRQLVDNVGSSALFVSPSKMEGLSWTALSMPKQMQTAKARSWFQKN